MADGSVLLVDLIFAGTAALAALMFLGALVCFAAVLTVAGILRMAVVLLLAVASRLPWKVGKRGALKEQTRDVRL